MTGRPGDPTLTLWQPWGKFVTMGVKRVETRPWPCPPALIGQRLRIHGAVRRPDPDMRFGSIEVEHGLLRIPEFTIRYPGTLSPAKANLAWLMDHRRGGHPTQHRLDFGAVIGSVTVTMCVPMVDEHSDQYPYLHVPDMLVVTGPVDGLDVRNQEPYGHFAAGRWAWLLADATEHDPIPARGYQRLWRWAP